MEAFTAVIAQPSEDLVNMAWSLFSLSLVFPIFVIATIFIRRIRDAI